GLAGGGGGRVALHSPHAHLCTAEPAGRRRRLRPTRPVHLTCGAPNRLTRSTSILAARCNTRASTAGRPLARHAAHLVEATVGGERWGRVHLAHIRPWDHTATTHSLPSNTSASSPVTMSPSSDTRSIRSGSLRTTFITWSSRYHRSMVGS